jgi:hypothetical protein
MHFIFMLVYFIKITSLYRFFAQTAYMFFIGFPVLDRNFHLSSFFNICRINTTMIIKAITPAPKHHIIILSVIISVLLFVSSHVLFSVPPVPLLDPIWMTSNSEPCTVQY